MTPHEYLYQRVDKVILDSDKIFNEGCRLIAHTLDWVELIDQIIEESWDALLRYSIRNKNATHSASVKLTFISDLLGKRVAKIIEVDHYNIKNTLSLGDLLLETFLQSDLIEIIKEYDGFRAPYVVRIKNMPDGVKPILIGTSFEPLAPITKLRSELTKEPFIKGWSDDKSFKDYLDKPFIRALESLRSVQWQLNVPLLNVLRDNPPKQFLEVVCKETGEIVRLDIAKNLPDHAKKNFQHLDNGEFLGRSDPILQRMVSKNFEYQQVLLKAQQVVDTGNNFYQEVSCDYRGRIYYAESFLEFQGSDIARSLFLFAQKKEVTEIGIKWMRIHAANSYNCSFHMNNLPSYFKTDYKSYLKEEGLDTISLDKMSLEDREIWALENEVLIRGTALSNTVIKEAEKPYAFLAVCYEINNYLVAKEQKLPYYSGLPIPIDGSNNGWQHLAAMSKDKQAGELVSLTNTPIQKDFYVAVAKELVRLIPDWFDGRDMPMKHIRKGIAKRGSMTRAYSAGKTRIAKNMYDDCHVEGFTTKYNITEKDCDVLAGKLIDAINTVCAGPLKTTKYLQKIAEHELLNNRNTLSWTTPSGFPVIYKANLQHERKQRGTIKGIPGNKDGRVMHVVRVDALTKDGFEKIPCRRSFASGISPNFVHSMDAAHMANTIISFGGCFAAVHDSFSTHADEVEFLQEVTKQTFIAQYDVDNFFDVMQDLMMIHKDSFKVEQPRLGKLNINEVASSSYFFC